MADDSEETITLDEMAEINEITKDYAKFLHVDSEKEIKVFYDSIELMLTKLDEFGGLLDTVRGETKDCLDKKVPELEAKCEYMKTIFQKIDHLEVFVNIVRQSVNATEEQVNKAESEMGSLSGLKKMFSSLVGTKKPVTGRTSYQPPFIFSTKNYLKDPSPVEVGQIVEAGEPVEQVQENAGNQAAEQSNLSSENT